MKRDEFFKKTEKGWGSGKCVFCGKKSNNVGRNMCDKHTDEYRKLRREEKEEHLAKLAEGIDEYTLREIHRLHNECGQCSSCHEWTSLLQPCCGVGVFFEGDFYNSEQFYEEHCECNGEGTCKVCRYIDAL